MLALLVQNPRMKFLSLITQMKLLFGSFIDLGLQDENNYSLPFIFMKDNDLITLIKKSSFLSRSIDPYFLALHFYINGCIRLLWTLLIYLIAIFSEIFFNFGGFSTTKTYYKKSKNTENNNGFK